MTLSRRRFLTGLSATAGANRSVYEAERPTLRVTSADFVEIGPGLGLHNAFTGMSLLSDRGRVAWIPGIGMNDPNLSHFVSADIWGRGSAQPDGTGWLGRYADTAFAPAGDVLRGITVAGDLPVMLRGHARSFVSVGDGGGFTYPARLNGGRLGAPWDADLLEAGFETAVTAADPAARPGHTQAALAGKAFLDATNHPAFGAAGTLTPRSTEILYPGDPEYPVKRLDGGPLSGSLSRQLKRIAQLLAANVDAEVFFARIGGWDTHANQLVDHVNLMRSLGGAVSAFYEDLATIQTAAGNAQDRTMLLGWSEFGRRVQQNQNGTDHGTAGLAFCVGRGVTGGFYGSYPDLSDLDGNGNMRFTVDYRRVYATVLERWLGLPAAATDALILQGGAIDSLARLGFV